MNSTYALELIQNGKRVDGRKLEDFREIEIKPGIIGKAEGSAYVRIGETKVIAGVKLNLGEPFSDTPEEGVLIVNAEFSPASAPEFEAGPPGEDAVELARVVDRGIRESKCINFKELCITPKEKVWCAFVDIQIISHQGNLMDASTLAALAALLSAKIPKIEGETVLRGEYEKPLPITHKPINITVGKVGDKFLVDPLLEEEGILESKLSVGVREDDIICSLQKQGEMAVDIEDIEKMVDIAIGKSKEIRKLL